VYSSVDCSPDAFGFGLASLAIMSLPFFSSCAGPGLRRLTSVLIRGIALALLAPGGLPAQDRDSRGKHRPGQHLARQPVSVAENPPLLRGLSRTRLLEYRDESGALRMAASVEEWAARRNEALAGFQKVAGALPGGGKRPPLEVRLVEEVDCGSYARRLIEYQSSPGGWVPAYLCLPKPAMEGRPAPAVLCLHPTNNEIGHQVVVGLGGKANRQYGSELAERGFVTLSPAYPLLANYQPDLRELGFSSGTMKAVWDNLRGLDLLESLPEVGKEAGFAVIGHSLGGHNAIYTAVFDERIRAVVSSCGFDSFLDYKGGNIQGWVQERYMPRMGYYLGDPSRVPFDFYELVACLAPRHVFVNAPLRDSNFQWDSVDRIAAAARPVFALHGAEDRLEIHHPDCDHDFPDQERFSAYDFIGRVLGKP
jgi:pimeloyl-ACP methyl ester carboxylesterase